MANLGRLAVALLGILAYQNRDKLGELVRGMSSGDDPNNNQADTSKSGSLMDQLSKGVAGTPLGDLLERFRETGSGDKVNSWVRKGPNDPLAPQDVEAAIDENTLASLSQQTGLSREELISRITRTLPEAVDEMTPDGQLPPGKTRSGGNLLDDVPPLD